MLPRSCVNLVLPKAEGGSRFTLVSNKLCTLTFMARVPLSLLVQHNALVSQPVAHANLHRFPLCSPATTFMLRNTLKRKEGKGAAVPGAEAANSAALVGWDVPI